MKVGGALSLIYIGFDKSFHHIKDRLVTPGDNVNIIKDQIRNE